MLFFGSVARIEASLAALLLSGCPALVVAGAVLLGRERATRVRLGALALTVVVLARRTGTVAIDGPPDQLAPAAPARAVAG